MFSLPGGLLISGQTWPKRRSPNMHSLSCYVTNVHWVNWNGEVVVVISLLAVAKISLCFGWRNGIVPVTAFPFQWLHVIFYCIDIPMIWHVLYLYYFMLNKSCLSLSLSESDRCGTRISFQIVATRRYTRDNMIYLHLPYGNEIRMSFVNQHRSEKSFIADGTRKVQIWNSYVYRLWETV